MDPTQALTEAVAAFQRNDINQVRAHLADYATWRKSQGFEPVTIKFKVKGDAIADALRVLLDSRLYPY